MDSATRLRVLELAVADIQRELRTFCGYAPPAGGDLIDGTGCPHEAWGAIPRGRDEMGRRLAPIHERCKACGLVRSIKAKGAEDQGEEKAE